MIIFGLKGDIQYVLPLKIVIRINLANSTLAEQK